MTGARATVDPLDQDRSRRLLLAEDSATTAALLRRGFEKAGLVVEVVGDGQQAADAAAATDFDAVVLDHEMPGFGGLVAAELIREDERRRRRRAALLVLLSAAIDESLAERARVLGVDHCIAKSPEACARIAELVRERDGERPAPSGAAGRDADLGVAYLGETRSRLVELVALLRSRDFRGLERVAHQLHGSGATYGFVEVSRLGREIELAARRHDGRDVGRAIELLSVELSRQPSS